MSSIRYDPRVSQHRYHRAPTYTVGLDLGQAKDYTALVILERHGEEPQAIYHARHLQRFPLGTPYPAIVASVADMLRQPPLANEKPRLAVDETGVGAPVVDLFKQARINAALHPIHITGGSTVNYDRGVEYVPKRNLVSLVQVALQTNKLKVASALPEAENLSRELQGFQVKITEAANDTYGAWRDGAHDDLVLAVALALYVGNKRGKPIIQGSAGYATFK
jgi:hypothetical protein